MRILTVTHYQPPHRGGIETVAAALVERYRRAGHEVVWLSSDLPHVAAEPGQVRVRAWNVLEDHLGVPYPLWPPGAAATIRQWVDWCDVAHCHDCLYLGTLLTLRRTLQTGKPVLLTQHVGPVPYRSALLRGIQQMAYATLGRRVHRRVDQVVFISHVVRAWFEGRVRYRHPPRFVANGVDTGLFQFGTPAQRRGARERVGIPSDVRVILFVGRFVEKKGTQIVEQLARRLPDSLFLLIGEGHINPRQWHLHNVRVFPFQSQTILRDYYWSSDALLLPSAGEGFPLVVMEAMACGCPAIISPDTFAAWNDGREFFLVSEPSIGAIAAMLEQLPTLLRREAVANYAQAQWNWDQVAEEYLSLLADLCRRAPNTVSDREPANRDGCGR